MGCGASKPGVAASEITRAAPVTDLLEEEEMDHNKLSTVSALDHATLSMGMGDLSSTSHNERASFNSAPPNEPAALLDREGVGPDDDEHVYMSAGLEPHIQSAQSHPPQTSDCSPPDDRKEGWALPMIIVTEWVALPESADDLGPSIQSDGLVCSALMRELACLGEPGFEPPPPDRFMTLVEGDGPTTREMWAQLGADVMMEHAGRVPVNLAESI